MIKQGTVAAQMGIDPDTLHFEDEGHGHEWLFKQALNMTPDEYKQAGFAPTPSGALVPGVQSAGETIRRWLLANQPGERQGRIAQSEQQERLRQQGVELQRRESIGREQLLASQMARGLVLPGATSEQGEQTGPVAAGETSRFQENLAHAKTMLGMAQTRQQLGAQEMERRIQENAYNQWQQESERNDPMAFFSQKVLPMLGGIAGAAGGTVFGMPQAGFMLGQQLGTMGGKALHPVKDYGGRVLNPIDAGDWLSSGASTGAGLLDYFDVIPGEHAATERRKKQDAFYDLFAPKTPVAPRYVGDQG